MTHICSYLYKTKKYEIIQYCCGASYSDPALQRTPWKSIGTLPDDQNERHRISQDAGQARLASYGGYLVDKVIKEIGWSGNFKRGQISYLFEEVDLTVFQ